MGRHEQSGQLAVVARCGRQLCLDGEQCIDRRVAGDVDLSADTLRSQVRGGARRRREQQFGMRIDRGSIFLLRPRQQRIMSPQTCLDVRYRHARREAGEGTAESARGITLYEEQVRSPREPGQQGFGHGPHMTVRIFRSGTIEPLATKTAQAEFNWLKLCVLARQDECRRQRSLRERVRDRCQFDRFGPGADDQPDVETQPSP